MTNFVRLLSILTAATSLAAPQSQTPAGGASFANSVQPFLARNCYVCHNAKLASGSLNLEAYTTAAAIAGDRDQWETILQKLQAGEMPPKAMPRPDPAALQTVTKWIQGELDRTGRAAPPNPGRVTARRLNRAEYDNTVRDLLGVDFHASEDFPQDDSGYGFDTIGDVLSLSPVLMEKYLSAAERIAGIALFGPGPVKPVAVLHQPPYRAALDGGDDRRLGDPPWTVRDYDLTGLSLPSALHVMHTFPAEGEYEFRIDPEGNRPQPSDGFQVVLWIDGKPAHTVEIEASDASTSLEGEDKVFRMRAPAGEHWLAVSGLRLYEGLAPSYGGLNPTSRPAPPVREFGPRKPPDNATPEELKIFAERQKALSSRRNRPPGIWDVSFRVNFLRITGPFDAHTGPSPESLRKIFTCGHLDGHHQPGCARKVVSDLARRAYRRPVTPREVDRLLTLVSEEQKRGGSFEQSIGVAIQALLVSPNFLFRIETDPQPAAGGDAGHPIGQYELASRLSYFLWSSMPDDELLRAAERNTLRQPEVLAAQVSRMLQDPKAHALVENFGGQWLQFRALESTHPDQQRFPYFNDYLRMSMQKETELFFENIIHEDRSILDFLDAKYTFLNEALARYYGIPGVTGPEFRKVDLTGAKRGGVLTQGSVLTVSSYATRTSVVLRGKWILDNILNAPVPPPPPNVPTLDEAATGTSMSLRQQMETHRTNAVCASCHARMDPLGFGLENYDATGQWRTQDGKFPIDASGTLPDGRSFSGPGELSTLLRGNSDAFAQCLTEKMMTYGLGRGLERYDRPAVQEVARHVAQDGYRFSSLVLEIARSLPFQKRKGDRAANVPHP